MHSKRAIPKKNGFISGLLVSSSIAMSGCFITTIASAQDQSNDLAGQQVEIAQALYDFDLTVNSIADGVVRIGDISGWRIAYAVDLPDLDGAREIRGTMSVPAAIEILIRGTGLAYRDAGNQSLILVAQNLNHRQLQIRLRTNECLKVSPHRYQCVFVWCHRWRMLWHEYPLHKNL